MIKVSEKTANKLADYCIKNKCMLRIRNHITEVEGIEYRKTKRSAPRYICIEDIIEDKNIWDYVGSGNTVSRASQELIDHVYSAKILGEGDRAVV